MRFRGDAGRRRDLHHRAGRRGVPAVLRSHWVETEAGISISFSIPFDTEFVERAEAVTRINKRMRRLHLSPRPIGASEPVDRAKAAVARSLMKLPRKLRA